MALICDTGPLYAAMDRSDRDHEVCARLLTTSTEQLVVPAPVLIEVEWLATSRLGAGPFVSFLRDVEAGALVVADLNRSDYPRVRELLERYADLMVGFVDAAVLAIVERFGERKLASLDHRHFATMRPRHVETIDLLPALSVS